MLSQSAQRLRLVGTGRIQALLHRWEDKEGVRLRTEVEVLGERTTNEEGGINFHLE